MKLTRREFLRFAGFGSFFSFVFGSLGSSVRFYFPNVTYEPSLVFKAGYPDEYAIGAVSTRWVKEFRAWIVRTDKGIYAVYARCTHLGCTPNYFEAEKRFKCPCHGSNFNLNGDVIAGPAPMPLYRAAISLAEDGQLLVDKSRLENKIDKREGKDFLLRV